MDQKSRKIFILLNYVPLVRYNELLIIETHETAMHTAYRYKEILDVLPVGIIISDTHTRVQYANKEAENIAKLSRHDLEKIVLYDRVHPDDQPKVRQYDKTLKARRHMTTNRRFKDGSGNYILLERNALLLNDSTQISLCRDISSEEEEHQQLELFMSIAGHELRNPLSNIQIHVDLLSLMLKKTTSPEHMAPLIHTIGDQIRMQTRMINDLLSVSKIKKGKLPFQTTRVDLKRLISNAVHHVSTTTQRTITISQLPASESIVWGDKDRLYQAFFNLLENASKFSAPPTTIEVALVLKDTSWEVAITDHGIGIQNADQVNIFLDYFQVEKAPLSGLGIGLFLVSEIVKHHHGTLRVKSTPSKGSTFTITLPSTKPSKE